MRKRHRALGLPSLPARSLADVTVPDDALKPDSELGKRTEEAAMELARWALLGIAGYGFLLKEMAMPNSEALRACQKYWFVLLVGLILLGFAAACALVSKERTILCSTFQVVIFRTLKKIENGGWSESEETLLKEDLGYFRSAQKKNVAINKWFLQFAHCFLVAGTVVTVICFGLVILSLKK
jgi:hypothetical protein